MARGLHFFRVAAHTVTFSADDLRTILLDANNSIRHELHSLSETISMVVTSRANERKKNFAITVVAGTKWPKANPADSDHQSRLLNPTNLSLTNRVASSPKLVAVMGLDSINKSPALVVIPKQTVLSMASFLGDADIAANHEPSLNRVSGAPDRNKTGNATIADLDSDGANNLNKTQAPEA